ncbi:PadR family transcriptional regulator [Pseudonocardia zijingensis]
MRRRRPREPDPVESEIVEDDVAEHTRRLPGAPARRRSGVVKVRDRQHVDLLLLAAATTEPANGYEMIDRVRERSDGLFELPLGVVIRALHRLVTNRLVQVTGGGGGRVRRYSATPLGMRVLATRRREWEAFSRGLDNVLDAAEEGDHRRDPGITASTSAPGPSPASRRASSPGPSSRR